MPLIWVWFLQWVSYIILTSDRDPHMLGQREDQMIDQVGMFDRHVKKSVNLPVVENANDFIWCQRLVNEALLELDHHGKGPVHINVPMYDYNIAFNIPELPNVTRFERLDEQDSDILWRKKMNKLKSSSRILVVCGQNSSVSDNLNRAIHGFFEKYNCAVAMEYMSNISVDESINVLLCTDGRFITRKKFEEIKPEIVVSFGGNIFSGIKDMLRQVPGTFEHWLIQENGMVVDSFKGLSTIFECTPEYFFEYTNKQLGIKNNRVYYELLSSYSRGIKLPEFEYSNVYAIKKVVERIPSGSILHLSINDSIRIANYCRLNEGVKVYANIGTFGIDGCMSTFLGQASAIDEMAFLVIGDLAYFYDMNAMRISSVKQNARILLINNHGGEEFYYNETWINQSSDLHTTARHNTKAEGWVRETGFKYLTAKDETSFDIALKEFMCTEDNQPILLEVFTEMSSDAKVLHDFYDTHRPTDIVLKGKKIIKSVIGDEATKKLKSILKFRSE
jgi:2-succinyl-5-enolpyruvyl-6-hydroxy-3-cyclohexene-1-carboxylate synthase